MGATVAVDGRAADTAGAVGGALDLVAGGETFSRLSLL